MKNIDVCLSPDLIHLYDLRDKTAVVVDILRATSCMTAGFANEVQHIVPFAKLEECKKMRDQGYLIAGERNGQKVDGFDLGNSPFDYMDQSVKGKSIAVTTTNGTLAISKSLDASKVVIASFLNKTAIANYLRGVEKDIVVVCAGWKGKFNLEDTLFAGALVESLKDFARPSCDAPMAAQALYNQAKDDLYDFLKDSSHAQRLQKFNVTEDIKFCLQEDKFEVVPVLNGKEIVDLKRV
ncbi:2-phosphosulfolactate phosphatase [Fulvivirgaceae bacterium BMA10]|uniref:Probable 2-phosphosulfolactate phosphatase n=1 Tax=Splendidivirga corallicola TaxID=3051826 RepID=A0ABT8KVF2_9BACT|nr:2-phosphosulfolactate phosphatase [Fulvivirgaceae bacterium BMA10]